MSQEAVTGRECSGSSRPRHSEIEPHFSTGRGLSIEILYRNAWITDWPSTEQNVADLAASGRARWKIENENNNTLKTKGYHLEHHFGHGQQRLSSLLATLNILAFLFHTVLEFTDENYRLIRATLPTR